MIQILKFVCLKAFLFLTEKHCFLLIADRFEELERRTHAGCKDDVKSVRDWPQASASVVGGLPMPPTGPAAARDLPLSELQRLYGPSFLPPVSGLGAVPPLLPQAWYQSPDLAAEMLQRERERLEQLGEFSSLISHKALDGARRPTPAASPRLRSADDLDPKGRLGVHGSMTS